MTYFWWGVLAEILLPRSLHGLLDLLDRPVELSFRLEAGVLQTGLTGQRARSRESELEESKEGETVGHTWYEAFLSVAFASLISR